MKLGDADRAVGALLEAAGGPDEFLERYDVLLCSDHGQTTVASGGAARDRLLRPPPLPRPPAPRRRRRLRLEPRGPGLPLAGLQRGRARALAERLDGHEAVDVVLFREDGDAVARRDREELRFRRDNGGFALAGDRRCSRPPRRARAGVGGARATRTRATCSSRRRRAGSSPTSAAATTPAGAATARSAPATRRCPMLAVGLDVAAGEHHRRSPRPCRPVRGRRPCRADELAPPAGGWSTEQLRGRDICGRARAGGDGARPARALRPGAGRATARTTTPRCRSAGGQTISQPYMVARICEALGLRGGETRARRRHRLRATRLRCSPSSPTRCTRSSVCRSLPRARARRSPPPATTASTFTSATARSACPTHAPFAAIAVAAAAPEVPRSLYEQLEPGGRLVDPRRRPCTARSSSSSCAARKGPP